MIEATRAYGLDFLFPAGDRAIGGSLRQHGEFSRVELDLLLAYASDPSGVLIDIGANIGSIALPFAAARPQWQVVAVEAHRGLSGLLAANVHGNRLSNVEAIHAAAGAERGLADFSAEPLHAQGNWGILGFNNPRVTRTEPVRMLTLDELTGPGVKLIKLDVEGFEPEVLKGAVGTLATRRAVWVAETNVRAPEASRQVIATFQAAGYAVHWFFVPFVTAQPDRGGRPERLDRGDSNVVALPPGTPNLWDLPFVTSPDAARPRAAQDYGYLARYGYPFPA